MKNLLKSMFSFLKEEKQLRTLNSLSELQVNDYIKLNDSYALPEELRGKTFQVQAVDSYYYGESLSVEWTLKGDTKKKVYFSISDLCDEDRIVLSYQLKKKEVEAIFGWDDVKQQYNPDHESSLVCKDASVFDGWLADEYFRRQCAGKGLYFTGNYSGKMKPAGGEEVTYYEFYNDTETCVMDVEVWSKDEVDVFISILRPETDVHEYWPYQGNT